MLLTFFNEYDAHQKRIINDWEFPIIFPKISKSVFKKIQESNQNLSKLKNTEIELSFLIQEIEFADHIPNLTPTNLPPISIYDDKIVSQAVQTLLVTLAQNDSIQADPESAYDHIFQQSPSIDIKQLERGFRMQRIQVAHESEFLDLIDYFKLNIGFKTQTFDKIQFVEGMKPWIEKRRPTSNIFAQPQNQQQIWLQQQLMQQMPQNVMPQQQQQWMSFMNQMMQNMPQNLAQQQQQYWIMYCQQLMPTFPSQSPIDQQKNWINQAHQNFLQIIQSQMNPGNLPLQQNIYDRNQIPQTAKWQTQDNFQINPEKEQMDRIYNSNGTQAFFQGLERPSTFIPHQDQYQIEEILKACFVAKETVFDHFKKYTNQKTFVIEQDFDLALRSLSVSFQNRSSEIFNTIQRAFPGNQGQIEVSDLDLYFHFSSIKTIKQIHEEVLRLINERQIRDSNMERKFSLINKGNMTCTQQDFKDVMFQCGLQLNDNDLKFVTRKYEIGRDEISYAEFLLELQKVSKTQEIQQIQKETSVDYETIIAETITKKLQIKNRSLVQFLKFYAKSETISKEQFTQIIGQELEVVPEYCTKFNLNQLFMKFNGAQWGNVAITEIESFFQQIKFKSAVQIQSEILKTLQQLKASAIFDNARDKNNQKTGKVPEEFFIKKLLEYKISNIDAEFLSSFYLQGYEIEVNKYKLDCQDPNSVKINQQKNEQERNLRQTQRVLNEFRQLIQEKRYVQELYDQFQIQSKGSTQPEYINYKQLSIAINTALTKEDEVDETRLNQMVSSLKKNQFNEYSYRDLFEKLIGKEETTNLMRNKNISSTSAAPPNPKILDLEKLKECQQILIRIRNHVSKNQRKDVRDYFKDFKAKNMETIDPNTLYKVLKEACQGSDQLRQELDKENKKLMSQLIYYLVREKPRVVSLKKLFEAFQQQDTAPPLAQEGIQTDQYLEKLNQSIKQVKFADPQQQQQQQINTKNVIPQRTAKQLFQGKFKKVDEATEKKIKIIQDYLLTKNITLDKFVQNISPEQKNSVTHEEFVQGILKLKISEDLLEQDIDQIFKLLDVNINGELSANEISLRITGPKQNREQKINSEDVQVMSDINNEIEQIFNYFDQGKGFITKAEVLRCCQVQNAEQQEQLDKVLKMHDQNNDNNIDLKEFKEIMMPIIKEEYFKREMEMEDIRAIFIDADKDHSGYLSIQEFQTCLQTMGTTASEISTDQLVNLFSEFDKNFDQQIDIDEFVTLLTVGDKLSFSEEDNMKTYLKIKKLHKLGRLDIVKVFKNLPQTLKSSFFQDRWSKSKKNLPSSVFKVQIDPLTQQWKDMKPLIVENLTPDYLKKVGEKPKLHPIQSQFGFQMTILRAEGIPIPKDDQIRDNIVKRVIRVGIFETVQKDFIFNTAQINGVKLNANSHQWDFENDKSFSLNPILFRTTEQDDLNLENIVLVFELVVYLKHENTTKELNCGWAQTPLKSAQKDSSNFQINLECGSPFNSLAIPAGELHQESSGIKKLFKMKIGEIKPSLFVSFKSLNSLETETKLHLEMLPSTCLIQKKMLFLVSGFRNYAAENLLLQGYSGPVKKPSGNVVFSFFPKILDCPDILETVAQVWQDDYFTTMTTKQKLSFDTAISQVVEIVTKIYPIFYSKSFDYSQSNAFLSVCGDSNKLAHRQQLLRNALRFNNLAVKVKPDAPEKLTTYKPFNMKEMDFQVWESTESSLNQIIQHFENQGFFDTIVNVAEKDKGQEPQKNVGKTNILVPQVN